jgi:hypothetical protein
MKKARGKRNQALFRDLGRGGIEKRNVYFDLYFRTNVQNYLFRLCRHNNLRGGHSSSSQKTCTTLRRKEKCIDPICTRMRHYLPSDRDSK